MRPKTYKVQYVKTSMPYRGGEVAAWPLEEAARLCAAGVCRPVDEDPELLAAIKAYKQPGPSVRWEYYLVQPNYFRFNR